MQKELDGNILLDNIFFRCTISEQLIRISVYKFAVVN
jgi:hypothetical protein